MMKKRKANPSRNYFTQETEDAILQYNNPETTLSEKDKLYSKYIHYPFFKLTQNIIHTFKFYNTDVEDLEHLQHQIEVFLLSKIHFYHHSKSIDDRLNKIINRKYYYVDVEEYINSGGELSPDEDGEVGMKIDIELSKQHPYYKHGDFLEYTNNSDKITLEQIREYIERFKGKVNDDCWKELIRLTPPKAYSYFGTITKRWLINYNNNNYKKKINKTSLDELSQDPSYAYNLENNTLEKEKLSWFMDMYIEYMSNNLFELFPKSPDDKIADAILDLFKRREDIDIFHKKALYFNIREKGDFKTPKVTKISNKMKKIFTQNYVFYLENGYIDFEDFGV